MILDGEFFSGGHLRWNLGWPTPNYAGAFLATLLALASVFTASRWRWAFFVAEAGGLFLLAKTYSRGAVVAWGLAWLFGVIASCGWKDCKRLIWIARASAMIVMLLATGFGWNRAAESGDETILGGASTSDGPTLKRAVQVKRSILAPIAKDGSVVNRLALWRGGLKMIAAVPLTGWGAGESGRAYMNWFQDIDCEEGYTTMVNSYLHVAVEHGLLVLLATLWFGAWLLVMAWCGARNEAESPASRLVQMAAGASLMAWAVANVFTTLWIEPRLWILPAAACFVLVWHARKNTGIRLMPLTVASLVIAVFAVGGLYGAGRWLLNQPRSILPGTNGSVMLASAGSTGVVWHVWSDPTVLGSTPGKELRRWLENSTVKMRLIVHRATPLILGEDLVGVEGVIVFGRQAERIGRDFPPDCRELWIVHPSVPPASLGKSANPPPSVTMVVLPQIDEAGNSPAWRRWASEQDARVVVSPGCGLDIRAVWPAVMSRSDRVSMAVNSPGKTDDL